MTGPFSVFRLTPAVLCVEHCHWEFLATDTVDQRSNYFNSYWEFWGSSALKLAIIACCEGQGVKADFYKAQVCETFRR